MEALPSTEDMLVACFREIEQACYGRNLVVEQLAANPGWIGVQLQGSTQSWNLFVECNASLQTLPRILLGAPRPLLAHVSHDGVICVSDGQGLSLDLDRHPEIVAYTVLVAYDLLERSVVDAATGLVEFFNELEGYWQSLPNALRGRATFEVDGRSRLINAYLDNSSPTPKWYFTERGQSTLPEFHTRKPKPLRAVYFHLDHFPTPPAYPDKIDHTFIEVIRAKLSDDLVDLWNKLLGPSNNSRKQLIMFISCPRPAGGLSLIGCAFYAYRGVVDKLSEVLSMTVRRQSPGHMRARGGAAANLMDKHVAILGCGAVGSVVADTLAASGVGQLTLVDHDVYSEDNVFRHILAPEWIDKPKVVGMKHELVRRYPGLQINTVPTMAQNWLNATTLNKIDGIVIAFGAPSIERSLARDLRKQPVSIPVVLTWLEALDLGGHSVLVQTFGEGCLDCLYRDEEGLSVLYPRTSFIEPGQHVSRNLTGCTSVFVPYGALQARRTALMAAEHLLEGLRSDSIPSYRYWKGDGTSAIREGLRTTPWWAAEDASPDRATARVFGHPCKRCRDIT